MKLEFDAKEIEQLLIDKANAMGIQANRADIECSYSRISRATVWFEEVEPQVHKSDDEIVSHCPPEAA